ncbi:myo-inosose-2 dehydratase [Sphingomonas sp. NSE70-1]|uniref:Myo-inosose-2 dehydratase n=1 Tax=Sphingomonas caseinilyticus TaxID=2908205 RepID=A0ABT0RX16_9SPHN|nr:myo-inosose-2 dehydratase [Sphingomonas caseinilyticus]
MTIRFGVSPIAWINDDMPELGGDTPLENVLRDIQEVGFAGVELGGKFPREPQELRALLNKYGLALVGGWYSSNLLVRDADAEIEALRRHLDLLQSQDCNVFIIAETSNAIHGDRNRSLNQSPDLSDDQWKVFGERMTRVADFVEGQGLRLAYHHHLGTVIESGAELDRFLQVTGQTVGLTLDTGHAALGGINAVSIMKRFPQRIAHVHCKDVRRSIFESVLSGGNSFLDGVLQGMFTVPGDGNLDFQPLFDALAKMSYAGWVIVEAEQDPAIADPRAYAKIGLGTLRTHARFARLEAVQ